MRDEINHDKGLWLEPERTLNYYLLKTGDQIEYRNKLRNLKIRILDGTTRTLMVDESQPVGDLMVLICLKIGITNSEEYGIIREKVENDKNNNEKIDNCNTLSSTLKRKFKNKNDDNFGLDELRKKIKTDDKGKTI